MGERGRGREREGLEGGGGRRVGMGHHTHTHLSSHCTSLGDIQVFTVQLRLAQGGKEQNRAALQPPPLSSLSPWRSWVIVNRLGSVIVDQDVARPGCLSERLTPLWSQHRGLSGLKPN